MKYLLSTLFLILAGCSGTPVVTGESPKDNSFTGMQVVSGVVFDEFYVKNNDVFKGYRAIILPDVNIANLVIDDSRLSPGDKWTLTDEDKTDIKRIFAEQAKRVFTGDKGLEITDQPGEHVLNAAFEFTKFYPSATKTRGIERGPRDRVFTRSVGGLYMTARLTDSVTGELLAVIKDAEEIGETVWLERNDRPNNIRKFKLTLQKWFRGVNESVAGLK